MTHDQLVGIARSWMRRTYRCPIVVSELVSGASEVPDALGFFLGGRTVLVECKASRADFVADAKKWFRVHPLEGMGDYRFFLAMPGVIRIEDLPHGWGLLEISAKGRAGVRVAERSHADDCICRDGQRRDITFCQAPFTARSWNSHRNERGVLVSLVRRLAGPSVRGRAAADINPYTNDEHGNVVAVEGASS